MARTFGDITAPTSQGKKICIFCQLSDQFHSLNVILREKALLNQGLLEFVTTCVLQLLIDDKALRLTDPALDRLPLLCTKTSF